MCMWHFKIFISIINAASLPQCEQQIGKQLVTEELYDQVPQSYII